MSKVFYDKPIIEQIFEEFDKNMHSQDENKLINLIERLPPEDVNKRNDNICTPLMLASLNGYAVIVKLLLEKDGINIYAKNYCDKTVLISASCNDNIEIVKLLLEKEDINVNMRDYYGNTALICATLGNEIAIVKLLLEKDNIDINIPNYHGCTALNYANPEIANLLKITKKIDL